MTATTPKDVGEAYRALGTDGFRERFRTGQRPFEPQEQRKQDIRVLPPIVDVMDFLGTPLPKPPELIKGILHKGSKLILSGASKSRKTWALAHLAICVATGHSWWGFDTTKGKVLYVNFELDAPFFQDGLLAIKDNLFLEGSQLKNQVKLWNLRGHAADLGQLADKVIDEAGNCYDLIILDPIYKVLGERDENSNGQMAELMNIIDRIIEATGAAVAFAHHYSKGNQAKKNAMDRMSGAGVFARDADSLLMMTEHQMADTYTVQTILRNHKPVEPFCVTLEHPIMTRWDGADPTKIKTNNGSEKKYAVTDVMKLLGDQRIIRAELKRQFVATVGGDGTFNKLYKDAQDAGLIEVCDDGKKIKAVNPILPPRYNAANNRTDENGAAVQE